MPGTHRMVLGIPTIVFDLSEAWNRYYNNTTVPGLTSSVSTSLGTRLVKIFCGTCSCSSVLASSRLALLPPQQYKSTCRFSTSDVVCFQLRSNLSHQICWSDQIDLASSWTCSSSQSIHLQWLIKWETHWIAFCFYPWHPCLFPGAWLGKVLQEGAFLEHRMFHYDDIL